MDYCYWSPSHASDSDQGGIEPRQRKRRNKTYPLMTKPRPEARKEVRLKGHQKKQKQLGSRPPSAWFIDEIRLT